MLLALEDGSALSRKVLVMFVVQKLEPQFPQVIKRIFINKNCTKIFLKIYFYFCQFPQASKTSIGHVVQLLYRASCFKVKKFLEPFVLSVPWYFSLAHLLLWRGKAIIPRYGQNKRFHEFLYFKVTKRDGDSSLMQLKEEFRTYDALRREHDAQ